MSIPDGTITRKGLGPSENAALVAKKKMESKDDEDTYDPTVVNAAARSRGVNDYFMDEGSFSDED